MAAHAPTEEQDLANLDAALFGESASPRPEKPEAIGDRRTRQTHRASRPRRFGLGVLVMLLVVGVAASAFALFGDDGGSTPAPKVEVRGTEVTRTTLRPSTTVTTAPPTTTSTTTTTVAPTTTRARAVAPEPEPELPPATDPPIFVPPTDPPPTDPPSTTPTTTATTKPPTTTTTTPPPEVTIPTS